MRTATRTLLTAARCRPIRRTTTRCLRKRLQLGAVLCNRHVHDAKPNGDGCANPGECASRACATPTCCAVTRMAPPCTQDATCRGGACSKSGVCMDSGKCLVDADCASTKFATLPLSACTDKLPNGSPVRPLGSHVRSLRVPARFRWATWCAARACAMCARSRMRLRQPGGTCDSSSAGTVLPQRRGAAPTRIAGYPDGEGPCSVTDQTLVCRSGICDPTPLLCHRARSLRARHDCTAARSATQSTGSCTQKLHNGIMVPTITGHTPALTGSCTVDVGTAVCAESVCDSNDDKCGLRQWRWPV